MKILVTGNMGYLGPVIVEHLRTALPDAEIDGFDAGFFSSGLTGTEVAPEVLLDRQYFGDVREFDAGLLEGTDFVVHLAAISNDPIGSRYEKVTFDINYVGTMELAKAARAAGTRAFVFASSCSMYGLADSRPRAEGAALNPLTPYAKSKVLAETGLRQLATPGFRVTCLRFSTACGMSPRLRLDLVLNDFVACAVAGQTVSVLSDGTPWRPVIDVRDMARAIEWALFRADQGSTAEYLAINVGSDERNYQVRDLANAVMERIPGGKVSIDENAPHDKRSYRVDFSLYKELAPGYQPSVDLAHSIDALRQGLEAMGFRDGNFRASTLMRINHLTRLRERGMLDEELRWLRRRPVSAGWLP